MKAKSLLWASAAALLFACNSQKTAVAEAKPEAKPENKIAFTPKNNYAEGQSLYENNCAKCHKLFAPTDFSQQDWRPILASMQKKAKLNDADMGKITNYIFSIQTK